MVCFIGLPIEQGLTIIRIMNSFISWEIVFLIQNHEYWIKKILWYYEIIIFYISVIKENGSNKSCI